MGLLHSALLQVDKVVVRVSNQVASYGGGKSKIF